MLIELGHGLFVQMIDTISGITRVTVPIITIEFVDRSVDQSVNVVTFVTNKDPTVTTVLRDIERVEPLSFDN